MNLFRLKSDRQFPGGLNALNERRFFNSDVGCVIHSSLGSACKQSLDLAFRVLYEKDNEPDNDAESYNT